MTLLVLDAQIWLTNQDLYCYEKFVRGTKRIIDSARENNIEVIYVQHDNGPGTGFQKGMLNLKSIRSFILKKARNDM